MPDGCETNLLPIAVAFEKATGIKVSMRATPVDDVTARVLLSGAGSGEEFDIAVAASFGIADLAEAGAILPLDEYAERYEPADFTANSLYTAANSYLGKFYGYQTDGDVYLMFLNRQVWDDSGLQEKAEQLFGRSINKPSSWADVDQLMAMAHRPAENVIGGDLFRNQSYLGWEFILRLQEGGTLLLADDLTPQINSDQGIRAAEAMFAATRSLRGRDSDNPLFGNWRDYSQGDSLINIGWGGSQKFFRSNGSAQKYGLTAFCPPGNSGGKSGMPYFNWGWNYAVSRNATQPELAYLFTLFASSAEMSTVAVRQADGFFDPHQKSHYLDKKIESIYSSEFLSVHKDAMNRSVPDFYVIGQGQYMAALNKFLSLIAQSKVSAKEGLDYAAEEWKRLHESIGPERQYDVWQNLKKRIPNLESTT